MAVFSIIATMNAEAVLSAAKKAYGLDFYKLSDDACLVAGSGSPIDVSKKIGLVDPDGKNTRLGSAVVTSVGSYYGVASPDIWEWMKSKWQGDVFD